MNYSDNAVMAKIRALYGKRLSAQDYDQLLQKKSVGEVAAYLKNETYYSRNLIEVREDLIHRGQLETLIRRRPLDTYRSLLKYSYDDKLFLRMYVMQNEINQLLLVIRLLNAGEINHYIISLPGYLANHMSFDLYALAKIGDYDGLLEVLSHSDYYDIIGPFRPTPKQHIDITGCEASLLRYYYQQLLSLVDHGPYSRDTRSALKNLLYAQMEHHNLSVMYRMKRFFSTASETAGFSDKIRACLIPCPDGIGRRVYEELLETRDVREFMERLQKLRVFRQLPFEAGLDTGHLVCHTYRIRQKLNQRIFRFSVKPAVVIISYMSLLDIEINNLTNIIEGIRYGIPPEEIRSLLAISL